MARQVIEADWTWLDGELRQGVQVALGDDGRIEATGDLGAAGARRLERRALLPGLVNAHSHAFQRGLRGRGETYPEGRGDFWGWRESMYALVESLDRDAFFELSRAAFLEMRRAGITAVGEFHYLHHGPDGADWSCDEALAAAAAEAGIRLVVLQTFYRWGGAGRRPLEGAQRRFETADVDEFWRRTDALAARLDPATQHLGAAVHSLRAATPDEAAAVAREARRRGLVVHLHAEEQRREIEACREHWGATPLELVGQRLEPGPHLTAVHCTHSRPDGFEILGRAGARVCICPTTEAGLADGIPDLVGMLGARLEICLGTDSNARISMTEEMRWLEQAQRLARERRGVVRDVEGRTAPALLAAATHGGAASLGLEAGRIAAGARADLLLLDLDEPSLAGAGPDELVAAWIFGGGDAAVAATAVAGRWRLECTTPGLDDGGAARRRA